MKQSLKIIYHVVLIILIILISSHVLALEQSNDDQTISTQEANESAPDLSEIIPRAAKLSGELAILQNMVASLPDISEIEKDFSKVNDKLKGPATQLREINDSKEGRTSKLLEIRKSLERENKILKDIGKPLRKAIRQFGALRNNWQAEKQHWEQWQSTLLKDRDLTQLNSTFEKANHAIDSALEIATSQLNSMLTTQEKAGDVQAEIITLNAKLDALNLTERSGVRGNISPPMFSSQYFYQFSKDLRYTLQTGVSHISWPEGGFFGRQGLIAFLQALLTLILIVVVFWFRKVLNDSKRWFFIAARPFSTGLFFGTMMFMLVYEYRGYQDTRAFVLLIIGVISFARLISALYPTSWKRLFVYGLSIALIIIRLMQLIMLPLPLYRLFMVLITSVSLLFCLRWAIVNGRQKTSRFYRWPLLLSVIYFAFIIIFEVWGKQGLAEYLFLSMIRSAAALLCFMLFIYMINGFIEWVFRGTSLKQNSLFSGSIDTIVRWVTLFIDTSICGLILLPIILFVWGAYDNLSKAITSLLTLGFNMGSQRISVGLVIISVSIFYGSIVVSRIVQKLLIDIVLTKRIVETGSRVSIARLVHYVLVFIGFLVALLALGFDFTKLTIMLSALGVGIGFGLQSVVNNFVSGLILLFERPVRVGDYIEFGGKWAEIKNIGLRATIVQTFDQADVIIPNADLVANQVVNWTLTDRHVRLIIPVGVAYGSDVALVMETLLACAKENVKVAEVPPPQVLFLNFGESSLDFELRVRVLDADNRMFVSSELHQEIDRRFRETKIEIAFPQRDLHLRSLDKAINLQSPEISE